MGVTRVGGGGDIRVGFRGRWKFLGEEGWGIRVFLYWIGLD